MTTTLDWYGCATFRMRTAGMTVFLDAYIDRVPAAEPVGLAVEDVDRADWIVVGHSHFDHVYGAERIAQRTGATILGSYETIRIMRAHGVPEAQLLPVAGGDIGVAGRPWVVAGGNRAAQRRGGWAVAQTVRGHRRRVRQQADDEGAQRATRRQRSCSSRRPQAPRCLRPGGAGSN